MSQADLLCLYKIFTRGNIQFCTKTKISIRLIRSTSKIPVLKSNIETNSKEIA